MDTNDAYRLATKLLREHDLTHWRFKFDNAKSRFGLCDPNKRVISLSRHLTELNPEAEVRETILHEIAHALTPGKGHGPEWKRVARSIGSNAGRTHDAAVPEARWLLICPSCANTTKRSRRTKTGAVTACGKCCREHNKGVWHKDYVYVWVANPAFVG